MAALYLTCNRNKRSIVLDLQAAGRARGGAEAGRERRRRRPQQPPAGHDEARLDYEAFKAVNPKIIYCGTYGYGEEGPYGARGALDDSIQAVSGIAMLNEMVLGEPRYLPTVVADKTTAMPVVQAVTRGALLTASAPA